MNLIHKLLHKLDLIRFYPIAQEHIKIMNKDVQVYFYICSECSQLKAVVYWYDEPLENKEWWQ